ncbi:STAS domain-containing protein [Acidiferrimicrobium sp. IK]|uniref:STAS domain-containing protein n=1 Tax=Acidiferrimicrobium sp. IK TaxID=2871700 RepID=UPI0021CB6BD8|nr:STAS domain-containing protein [Acidiferrimicrobium sp. IK]MCU4185439.1 STAS domain-containing protein [Acidiferrimicrobium sp. IK]
MNFEVELDDSTAAVVARVRGELDIATTPTLRAAVEGIDADRSVVIDLSPTTFIDSTACRYFVQLARRAAEAGRSIDFVCPADNYEVWRVLDLLGLLDALGVQPTVGE